MLSKSTARHDSAFVVRIWWEHGSGNRQEGFHWRGWIQHVRNGHHVYFSTLAELDNFIKEQTGIPNGAAETTQGLV